MVVRDAHLAFEQKRRVSICDSWVAIPLLLARPDKEAISALSCILLNHILHYPNESVVPIR